MAQKSNISNVKKWVIAHKTASIIIAVVILFVGYRGYAKIFGSSTTQTTYAIAAVGKQTIISTVTGSGQVSATNQVSLTAKVSGDIVAVPVKVGQVLGAGQLIAQIDSSDAKYALESAKISLAKLTEPATELELTQAESAVEDAQTSLTKAYNDGYDAVISAFTDMPAIKTGVDAILNNINSSRYIADSSLLGEGTAFKYKATAVRDLAVALSKYDQAILAYQQTKRTDDISRVKILVEETSVAAQALLQAVKDTSTAVNFIIEQTNPDSRSAAMTTDKNNLASWGATMISTTANLVSAKNSITTTGQTLKEKQLSLRDLKTGADSLDIRSQEISVAQKQSAYDDSFVRAPFDGVVASLSVQRGDTVNSGSAVATFITKQKTAEIVLNEVDITKVKAGQKVNLTFDAIDGLTITGQVATVDLVGAVSQGVVSYPVKIVFDTQDDRVKSGMSVNATIITDVKPDVLAVPNSAVKTSGNNSTVQLVSKSVSATTGSQTVTLAVAPTSQAVTLGLSDDNYTEIVSGLSEGDKVVTKTVAGTAATSATAAPSIFSAAGVRTGGSGGNAARAIGR